MHTIRGLAATAALVAAATGCSVYEDFTTSDFAQQDGDPIVDSIDRLAIPGDQGFAHRIRLRAAVAADQAAGLDGGVQGLQAAAFKQLQRLAGDGADEQVEQLAVHTVRCRENGTGR